MAANAAAKWGEQNHNDGTGGYLRGRVAEHHKAYCDSAFAAGTGAWRDILQEEVSEAFAESDPVWIEAIDRRKEQGT